METIKINKGNLAAYQESASSNVMALGCFDGLHRGHVKVIQSAFLEAKERNVQLSVILTRKRSLGGRLVFTI